MPKRPSTSRRRSTTSTTCRTSGTPTPRWCADTIARYKRLRGRRRLLPHRAPTSTGRRWTQRRSSAAIAPKELADQVVKRYHELWKHLEITNDDFIRTTEKRHHAGVHALIARMQERATSTRARTGGGTARGARRSSRRRSSWTASAPTRGTRSEWLEEESYFFRLSAYQEPLLAFYREHPEFIRPESRYNEVVRFVEMGLKDLSISRVAPQVGHPVARATRSTSSTSGSTRCPTTSPRSGSGAPTPPCTSATGRRRCTSSARTSCASTASTGRRS